jgi:hypothetical protein
MMVVIGLIKASRQDFKRKVGKISSAHVASEECSMAVRTSSVEAGVKLERQGGGVGGAECEGMAAVGGKEADNFEILSLK